MQNADNKNEESKGLESVIKEILAKAKGYEINSINKDKKILLETYGLILGLCQEINNEGFKKETEHEIINLLNDFIFVELFKKNNVAISNLINNRQNYLTRLNELRTDFVKSDDILKSLKDIDDKFTEIIIDIFNYVQRMLGPPNKGSKYALVSVGSLATQMTTPYSDVEYVILVDKLDYDMYFTNFSDLFELLMISFAQSPICAAEDFLKDYKQYFQYIKIGARLDEKKQPQKINRLYKLINNPINLLTDIATTGIIHKIGNHTTSALLTTRYLDVNDKNSDKALYDEFMKLFQSFLPTVEYLDCLRELLAQDIEDAKALPGKIKEIFSKEGKVDIKKILIQPMHLARQLLIFFRSTEKSEKNLELKNNFFDVIEELKKGEYINQEQYQIWYDLVAKLLALRLELQIRNRSAKAEITREELVQKFGNNMDILLEQLKTITKIVENHLSDRKHITHTRLVADITKQPRIIAPLPIQAHKFVGREKLLKELDEKLHAKENSNVSPKNQELCTVNVYAGLGGIGKTQLALEYIHNAKRYYTLKHWFQAQNVVELEEQYKEFAKKLECNDAELSFDKANDHIKKWLIEHPGWLLIYDNVNSYDQIKDFLPEKGGFVILTTRNPYWPNTFDKVNVPVMDEDDAIALIQSLVPPDKMNESQKPVIKELVKTLGYLPLALNQAGAYIRENPIDIQGYLDLYNKKKTNTRKALLNYKSESSGATHDKSVKFDINFHEPVWVTFEINFNALEMECPAALTTLKQASWLDFANIPAELLSNMAEIDNESIDRQLLWNDIYRQIERYSLMQFNVQNQSFNIHPLLQEILRDKQPEEEQVKIFKHVCNTIDATFKGDKNLNLKHRDFLPHAEQLNKHGEHVSTLATKFNYNDAKSLLIMPNCLDDIYFDLSLAKKRLPYLIKAKKMCEECHGSKNIETALALKNLGDVSSQLGNLNEAENYYMRALEIYNEYYGKDDIKTTPVLANLGLVFWQLGKLNDAKIYYERVLPHYSEDDVKIAIVLGNLGVVFRDLGQLNDAKSHLKRALSIRKGYFGAENFQTAFPMKYLGDVLSQLGNLDEAKEHLILALKIEEAHYGKENFETAKTLVLMGDLYRRLGHIDDAESHLKRAFKIEETHYGKNNIMLVNTLYCMGLLYLQSNQLAPAQEHALRAKKIATDEAGGQQYLPKIDSLLSQINVQSSTAAHNTNNNITMLSFSGANNDTMQETVTPTPTCCKNYCASYLIPNFISSRFSSGVQHTTGGASGTLPTGPSVSSNHGERPYYLSAGFSGIARNIGNATRQFARPMLFKQSMAEVTRGLSQFITSTSRAGIVDSLQQLARPSCSPDSTARISSFRLR